VIARTGVLQVIVALITLACGSPEPVSPSTTARPADSVSVAPPAALATPLPPGFNCGVVAIDDCRLVAEMLLGPDPTLGFDTGLIVSARVRPTIYKVCPSLGDTKPTFDVEVLLSRPSAQVTVTYARMPSGSLAPCTY
jgi:hypothetical protein